MFRVVSRSLTSRLATAPAAFAAPRAAFSAPGAAPAAPAGARAASTSSSLGALAYQLVFKRNVVYVSAVFFGAIVFDAVFGSVMKGAWRSMNHGRLFGASCARRRGCAAPPGCPPV